MRPIIYLNWNILDSEEDFGDWAKLISVIRLFTFGWSIPRASNSSGCLTGSSMTCWSMKTSYVSTLIFCNTRFIQPLNLSRSRAQNNIILHCKQVLKTTRHPTQQLLCEIQNVPLWFPWSAYQVLQPFHRLNQELFLPSLSSQEDQPAAEKHVRVQHRNKCQTAKLY